MSKVSKKSITLFFLLFTVSGFSGLIYESIWSHYLKLFLGHAAYAQTLVLIIFMGGMALGSWLVGRYTTRIRSLLKWYALTEGVIGLLAVLFHPIFTGALDLTYYSLIPSIETATLANIVQWLFAALLILPQSVLLGATFPFMSGGVIRVYPQKPGRTLSILYFTNSLGAAVGVLVSGFWLVDTFGLPGTIITAGIINILLAAAVMWLSRVEKGHRPLEIEKNTTLPDEPLSPKAVTGFMLVAAFTGMASFLYEIGWIRMLSLVLGSSEHAFELMLSAFILGLAIGGFWISRRIDRLVNPVKTLGIIQLFMGGLALLTLVSYGETFQLMSYAVKSLPKTEQGYLLFNLFSHGISMLIMIPATICAGMTLPLITYYLLRRGQGEGSIGKIYAANTIGSIVGIVLGVQFIMPVMGVKNLVTIGGGIDILVGILLLYHVMPSLGKTRWIFLTAIFSAMVIFGIFGVKLNPLKMASGVYRHGRVETGGTVVFQKDGKTASISLVEFPAIETLSITTNGKPDAAIGYSATPRPDELTMVLLAALPMSHKEDARTVANVGLGSGLTSQVALLDPEIQTVDTVEIESTMVEGAKMFGDRVALNYNDPRSHIYIDDAKTFFHTRKQKYDIIISEPSNPWISGISGLFSVEFYGMINRYLSEGGVFAQWVHLYEMDIPLVASIIKAISANFKDYVIYFANDTNIIILASNNTIPAVPGNRLFTLPGVRKELNRIGIFNNHDLLLRRLGSQKTLDAFFHSYDIPANSDYFPVLPGRAVRARFMGKSARELNRLFSIDSPFLDVLEGDTPPARSFVSSRPFGFWQAMKAKEARAIYQYCISLKNPKFIPTIAMHQETHRLVRAMLSGNGDAAMLQEIVFATLTFLSPQELPLVWSVIESSPLYRAQSEDMKRVLLLYKALGNRDFPEVRRIAAGYLPPEGPIKANERNDFLIKVSMLANIQLQDLEAAQELWDRYEQPEQLPLDLRLLKNYIKLNTKQ